MKNVFKIFALFLFVVITFGATAQNTARNAQPTEQSDQAVYSIKVTFHCANGKALLETELPKKRGVIAATANLETKIVDVTYHSKLTGPDGIRDYIHQIGYLVEGDPAGTQLEKKACTHGDSNKE